MEIDELAGDDDDEYYVWATALNSELQHTPPNDVARRLYEAYEERAGEIRSEFQVERLRLMKKTKEDSVAHAAELGSAYRRTRLQSAKDELVARQYTQACQPIFEELERMRDEKLGIVQDWYKVLGTYFRCATSECRSANMCVKLNGTGW
jgi:hypothetical protein